MKRSRSNNPEGRPREYEDKLRTISLSLPDSLVQWLDQLADDAGISRQRLIVEWLVMGQLLEAQQYIWTTAEGTFFDEWPKRPPKVEGMTRTPFTYNAAAAWFAKWAEQFPDMEVQGMQLRVTRDRGTNATTQSEVTGIVQSKRRIKKKS